MKVLVAGATGAIGRHLVAQLVGRGHEVVGTTRSADRTETLRALGAEPVIMDVLDPDAVANAVAKAEPDVIVHQATALNAPVSMRNVKRMAALSAHRRRGLGHGRGHRTRQVRDLQREAQTRARLGAAVPDVAYWFHHRTVRAPMSLSDLCDELRPPAFAIAYRMLGSVAEAEDVVQEAFLRMHRTLERDEHITSPRAYIATWSPGWPSTSCDPRGRGGSSTSATGCRSRW
jgi:hypothetical protein